MGIKAALKDVYEALFLPDRLVGWWPQKASGSAEKGSHLRLGFPGYPDHVWELVDLSPNERVHMKFMFGPVPWKGTELVFTLKEGNGQVWVTLDHITTQETPADAFQYFCTKWPTFLVSLKELLETGKGRPYPDDIKIQHD